MCRKRKAWCRRAGQKARGEHGEKGKREEMSWQQGEIHIIKGLVFRDNIGELFAVG